MQEISGEILSIPESVLEDIKNGNTSVSSGTQIKNEALKNELYKISMERLKKIFDAKVEEFLSKYPKYEIQTFETKRKEAEKFLSGETSTYLEGLLEKKNEVLVANGKNPLSISDFANIILLKADEYAEMYFTLEAWKDVEIEKIKALYT